MGLLLSSGFRAIFLASCFLDRFLCSTWNPVSSSRPAVLESRRAQELSRLAVAPTFPPRSALARPYLDSSEHGGTLDAVGMTIRGEPAFGRAYQSRRNLVFGGSKDPNHDAVMRIGAKLRGGGPILFLGTKAIGFAGTPPPRTVIGDPSQADGLGRNCPVSSATSVHCAGRRTMPSGTTPSRTSRHKAIKSLRAKATIMSLRVPRAFSVRARNHCAKVLFF